MTDYENYLDKIWNDEIDSVENPIDWLIIKQLKGELVECSADEGSEVDYRVLTDAEFNFQVDFNPRFKDKWTL